jgi:hypothetical protein
VVAGLSAFWEPLVEPRVGGEYQQGVPILPPASYPKEL